MTLCYECDEMTETGIECWEIDNCPDCSQACADCGTHKE